MIVDSPTIPPKLYAISVLAYSAAGSLHFATFLRAKDNEDARERAVADAANDYSSFEIDVSVQEIPVEAIAPPPPFLIHIDPEEFKRVMREAESKPYFPTVAFLDFEETPCLTQQ